MNKLIFIIIGFVELHKGQDILLEAIKRIDIDLLKRCEFIIVGNKSSLFARKLETQIEEIPQTCSKLSLSNNKISFINSKFFSNLQLKYLDLSFNRIISLQGFEKFKLLEELNLSNNYIGDEQLNFLTYLTKIKTINLSNNNLRNEEVKNIIYKIKTLQKINLSNIL